MDCSFHFSRSCLELSLFSGNFLIYSSLYIVHCLLKHFFLHTRIYVVKWGAERFQCFMYAVAVFCFIKTYSTVCSFIIACPYIVFIFSKVPHPVRMLGVPACRLQQYLLEVNTPYQVAFQPSFPLLCKQTPHRTTKNIAFFLVGCHANQH